MHFLTQQYINKYLDFNNYNMPLCFESLAQWTLYIDFDDAFFTKLGYCAFCTPQYKAAMIAQGRCAYPQSEFKVITYKELPGTISTDLICVRNKQYGAYIVEYLYGAKLIDIEDLC